MNNKYCKAEEDARKRRRLCWGWNEQQELQSRGRCQEEKMMWWRRG
jgi:hypothetical protein